MRESIPWTSMSVCMDEAEPVKEMTKLPQKSKVIDTVVLICGWHGSTLIPLTGEKAPKEVLKVNKRGTQDLYTWSRNWYTLVRENF
jgi:hypothetical protein